MSLRYRLLVGLVVVVALGLGVAATVSYGEIRSYLVNQLNQQTVQGLDGTHFDIAGGGCARGTTPLPVGSYVFLYSVAPIQALCNAPVVAYGGSPPPAADQPQLPQSRVARVASSGNGAIAEVRSPSGLAYDVYAAPIGQFGGPGVGEVAAAAVPFSSVDGTMHRLLLVELAVSLAVLLALAGLGYAVVRVGLRPLEDIEETAGKIAAGDLSRRVQRDESETEIGRLGASLNAMLAQIEHAFGEQQASERRMRQFVADAAHELRTPLTSIRGYAELFRRGAAARPEDLARSMRRIENEGARMGVLVDDLLLLARLDQGRPIERARVDLGALAADAAADAQAVEPDRDISFEAPGGLVVDGDETRLRQVIGNLVQNALVHTPAGTPVSISVHAEGDLVVLDVTDSGPGIAPEHAARIFERFYRADSSRARNSGGSGLGLAIVASLAAAHGGRASVQTAPGAGARFRVELPRAAAGPPGGAAAPRATGADDDDPGRGAGLTGPGS